MILETYYNGIEIHREDKIVYVKFLSPHRVISTDSVDGGLSEQFTCLYNHQSCEASGHHHLHDLASHDPREYKRKICESYGLPYELCASLGTAANMHNLSTCRASYRDLEVVAVCTGGVETNAGRAGEPAAYYEHDGIFDAVEDVAEPSPHTRNHGTINTMVFINRELVPGAMVRAVITATEAKTAMLQELEVHSRFSDGLATGTGTDQVGIASQLGYGKPLTAAGNHTKLGELIGKTVHDAIGKTLMLQNGLTPLTQCSATVLITRLGSDRDTFCAEVGRLLQTPHADLLRRNFSALEKDPMTVAAVAALVHLRDKFAWGILPESCMPEILSSYGAQIAAAVSGKYDHIHQYRKNLAEQKRPITNETFLDVIYRSFALGFSEKWS
jgi:adenosylcobinamide amidohydrolase